MQKEKIKKIKRPAVELRSTGPWRGRRDGREERRMKTKGKKINQKKKHLQ
jgi:hypothetical protein